MFFPGPNEHLHLEIVLGILGGSQLNDGRAIFFEEKNRKMFMLNSSQEFLLRHG